MLLNIVLVEPEIPQNTGNIARTCAAAGAKLHLVGPLGFSLDDKYLKRAGLDYWDQVDVEVYADFASFWKEKNPENCWYITTKGERIYSDVKIEDKSWFFFGKETKGLPEPLLRENYSKCIRIPMLPEARSLNLSNAAAIVIYEALRQQNFAGFKTDGKDIFRQQ